MARNFAVVLLVLLFCRASIAASGYLPAVVKSSGLGGANWRTRLVLSNPHSTQTGTVQLFLKTNDSEQFTQVSLRVRPDATIAIEDVMGTLFGAEGLAFLSLIFDDFLEISANTSTEAPCGGTVGQEIPLAKNLCPPPEQSFCGEIPFVRAEHQRVNVGVVALGAHPPDSEMLISVFDCHGVSVGSKRFPQADNTTLQVSLEEIAGNVLCGSIRAYFTQPSYGHYQQILYTSTIDNMSNDADFAYDFCRSCY